MNTRIYGMLWRPEKTIGNCQLLTSNRKYFSWSHGYKDDTLSARYPITGVTRVINRAMEDGAYWIGPEEMSGWEND